MNKAIGYLKWISVFLLLFTAVNAIVAGSLFCYDSSGKSMGLNTAYLQFSPFDTYLIPGLVLIIVIGIMNLIASISMILKKPYAFLLSGIQGILLCGWILIQMLMVRDFNPLHAIMLGIGLLLVSASVLSLKFSNRE